MTMGHAAHAVAITIDDEFAGLIPPLAEEERRELEANLVAHGGARDALVVWDRGESISPILLDGHNRLEICERLGLPYRVKGIQFASRDEALSWMERNQLGRRNLTRETFTMMLGRLYNRMKLPVGGRRNTGQRTREKLAAEYGIDPRTIDRAGQFQAAAEKLGIEADIASGRVRVTAPQVVAAAKSVRDNPSRGDVRDALHKHRATKDKRNTPEMKGRREPQSWLVPAEPADCLKAIRFYAKTFMWQSPESVDALHELLARLIEETAQHAQEIGPTE